jgi:hypothetical protein
MLGIEQKKEIRIIFAAGWWFMQDWAFSEYGCRSVTFAGMVRKWLARVKGEFK